MGVGVGLVSGVRKGSCLRPPVSLGVSVVGGVVLFGWAAQGAAVVQVLGSPVAGQSSHSVQFAVLGVQGGSQ